MGFRNPVTSLDASQITGLIAGTQLAADSINGKTITGSTFQTAATGRRVVMSSEVARRQQVEFYTGNIYETEPGRISGELSIIGPYPPESNPGEVRLTAPILNGLGYTEATIALSSASHDNSDPANISINAPTVYLGSTVVMPGPVSLTGTASVAVPLTLTGAAWQTLALVAPWTEYVAWTPAQYRKDAAGRVSMRGLIKFGGFGSLMFTLPVGYRPTDVIIATVLVAIDGVEKSIRVTINADGTVTCGSGTGVTINFLSLSQLDFTTL